MPSIDSYGSQKRYGGGGGQRFKPYSRPGGRGGASSASRHNNDIVHVYEKFPKFANLQPFRSDFSASLDTAALEAMTEKEVKDYRAQHSMTLTGNNIPRPMLSFQTANFPPAIAAALKDSGFDNPTPIQAQGCPMALSGRNVVGIAQTGSGKTLSFVLPALIHILDQAPIERGDGPIALVLAPTRELAVQIQEVAQKYGKPVGVRTTCLYGGASKGPQIGELNRSPHFMIATPGRLLDLLQAGKTNLRRITYLVLDEADRMLDMGFEQPLRDILAQIRPDRQMLFWSATWPKSVKRLAHDFLSADHITVQVGSTELQANKRITQIVRVMDESDKEQALSELLNNIWEAIPGAEATRQMCRTIVFSNKKYLCDRLVGAMLQQNWPAVTIHGDKTQQERDWALREFKTGKSPILVATDVAARGLDVKDVQNVINFDFPNNIEDYVHRIGRTARGADTLGTAYTFMGRGNKQDKGVARDLVELMRDANQEIPRELEEMAARGGGGKSGGGRGRGGYG
ncbi:hypothetical protein HK104_005460, partial [Borealophlyctis nickersoniae]